MTLDYGKGRVFHTVLGHADYSMNCVGFITTLQRGAEWAATGKVTIPVPKDFPTADKSQLESSNSNNAIFNRQVRKNFSAIARLFSVAEC